LAHIDTTEPEIPDEERDDCPGEQDEKKYRWIEVAIAACGSFCSIVFIDRCRRERRVRIAKERRKDFQTLL